MEKRYNIHDLVSVGVVSNSPYIIAGYDHYLRFFEDPKVSEIDYGVVDFSKDFFKNSAGHIIDFSRIDSGICFPKEGYAISFDKNKIKEYTTYANRATNLFVQALLLVKGFSFVHGAGIEMKGRGIIFPALGGVGKTLLISALRNHKDFKFFGDDYVIVGGEHLMYSYPSDFSIYPYHVPLFNELKNSSSEIYLKKRNRYKLFYECKRAINFIFKRIFNSTGPVLKKWNASYVKIPAEKLIQKEKIGKRTVLDASIFLERYDGENIFLEPMDIDSLIGRIMGILDSEFNEGMKYLSLLASVGEFNLIEFRLSQETILRKVFSHIKLYQLKIPNSLSPKEYCDYISKDFIYEI